MAPAPYSQVIEVAHDTDNSPAGVARRAIEEERKFKDQCREAATLYLDLNKPWGSQKIQNSTRALTRPTKTNKHTCRESERERPNALGVVQRLTRVLPLPHHP